MKALTTKAKCLIAISAATALCGVLSSSAVADGGNGITGLTVRNVAPARYFPATDDRNHVEFDLVVTNALRTDATLKTLVVRTGSRTVLKLSGDALARITHPVSLGLLTPTATIAPAGSVVVLVDVKLRGSVRGLPRRLSSSIRYSVAPGPLSTIVDNNVVALKTKVDGRLPRVIAPPLRGTGWLGLNACCDPDGSHRSGLLAIDNRLTMIEAFAIDYERIVNGSVVSGDGSRLTDFYGYGEPIHSVARGKVVAVHKGMPDAPWPVGPPNLTVKTSADFTGNSVIVKIGTGQYALYAHMKPDSIRVREGQRLRTGQVIGLLGNSGNSFGPHLHFAIQSAPRPFARSVPYVFDRFKLEGTAEIDPSGSGAVAIRGPARQMRRVYPRAGEVTAYER